MGKQVIGPNRWIPSLREVPTCRWDKMTPTYNFGFAKILTHDGTSTESAKNLFSKIRLASPLRLFTRSVLIRKRSNNVFANSTLTMFDTFWSASSGSQSWDSANITSSMKTWRCVVSTALKPAICNSWMISAHIARWTEDSVNTVKPWYVPPVLKVFVESSFGSIRYFLLFTT